MATPTPSTNTPSRLLPTFSSPAARSVPHTGNTNMLPYDSPAMLNMLNDASSGMGGVGMGISMSGLGMSSLGISASAMGRADEAERTRRLQNIIEIIGAKPGRVSEEGMLALCKRLGVQVEKNTAELHSWMLLIGDEAVCDITFRNDEIDTVNLQTGLDGEQPDLHFGATGSQILVESLRSLPGQSKINVTLERFSANLEKLLALDKLGAPQNGGVSCYNAIAGVYTSLRKLFEHEKKMALAVMDANTPCRNYKAEREVLCKKSGRPRLNGASCLGLSLEYWMDRRHLISKKAKAQTLSDKGKGKMDMDTEAPSYPEDEDRVKNKLYSLTIECESSPSTLYPPIRISNQWLSPTIENHASVDDLTPIPWLDPKPTYLEPSDSAMDLDATPGRLPNIRFVAKFNPPLIVPFPVHMQLHAAVNAPLPDDYSAASFVGLALRPGEDDPAVLNNSGSTHCIRSSRRVLVKHDDGGESFNEHETSLFVPKVEYSRVLESLPFEHPRQIVEILPVLRQYACVTSLLKDGFYEPAPTASQSFTAQPKPPTSTTTAINEKLNVDVTLHFSPPDPRLTFYIPHPSTPVLGDELADLLAETQDAKAPICVTLDVLGNGEVSVVEQNVCEGKEERLAKAFDVIGGFGIWAEWVRRDVRRGEGEGKAKEWEGNQGTK
jgi:hypothetical protein